jgi:ribosomal protein S1
MQRYNNVLPEQLNYLMSPKYNDFEMLKRLKMAMSTGEIMAAECIKTTEGGDMVLELSQNVVGLIPRNEVTYIVEKDGNVHKGKAQKKVFLNVNFKVKDIIEGNAAERSKIFETISQQGKEFIETKIGEGKVVAILSRKEVVEEIRDKYKAELHEGHLVQGVVFGIEEYGAFIDIGGDVSGLLPKAEICKVWINHPSEKLAIGDPIDVVVKEPLGKKRDNEVLISFTRKPLAKGWDEIEKLFKKGEVVKGRVKDTNGAGGTGIFIEVSDDFEGLADYKPGRRYNYGDYVRVRIDHIDPKKEKLKLTIID